VVRASQQKRQQVRWETADGAAEPALFGTPEERIRHPEFRDLEFIHVRSKSIINEVPAVSRVPFRYTINVYRGCSHACSYCFARPTHEYLDLDAGRDFERVIVVKTNAVELLRHELRPSRWAGEHIAMGTNTDPYQRAEGRYRLTRGVIEVLTEHANPFSILTKSSLVLRDLDLLRAAHERTDIAVNFSIGTLDRDVWRETEPGTPNPHSRVEALATLREAGIHAGVLIAPVIPGVSDAPEQLDEVVRACVDAGASSISPIVLHLRPGVKEQFMPWLADTRPDLLERYRRLYPRSYAPKVEQQRISRLVRDLVSRHSGGRLGRTSSGEARRVGTAASSSRRPAGSQRPASPSGDRAPREEAPEQAAAEEPPARQLDLGI
jgi:DNA repair photolyase